MSASGAFQELDWQRLLPEARAQELPWSLGLLRVDPAQLFPDFWEHWGAFFHTCGIKPERVEFSLSLEPLTADGHLFPFVCRGEAGVLVCSQQTEQLLARAILDGQAAGESAGSRAATAVVEYLARRLLSSLEFSRAADSPQFAFQFAARSAPDEIDIAAVFSLRFVFDGQPCALQVGLGPELCRSLDSYWISRVGAGVGAGERRELRVRIAGLALEPARLIDYLRAGTLVDLGLKPTTDVSLLVDGQLVALGALELYGPGAVLAWRAPERELDLRAGHSLLSVELGAFEIDAQTLAAFSQPGARLAAPLSLGGEVALMMGAEQVGRGQLGELGGHLALKVL